jgi:hypothetical protein
MAFQSQYSQAGALWLAGLVKAGLAESVIHLYAQSVSLLPTLTLAQMEAVEANYDGYTPITVAAWAAAFLDPAGGADISSGYEQFQYGPAASPPVTNSVLGLFIVTSGGVLLVVQQFATPLPMSQIGDAVPVTVLLNFGS